jgi:short-subunit dehydrogenase
MRIVAITGGTKGIGRAIAELFLEENYRVYISARNKDSDFQHSQLRTYEGDMSTKEGVTGFVGYIKSKETTIDILVNNVGVFIPGSILDEEEGNFEIMLNTNLASTYHMCRAAIDLIKKSDKPYIFNICSTASITPYINGGSYCISKYAQLGLTKVLREELKNDKIKVSAVMPGATYTNSWAGSELPISRFSEPTSIANLILAAYRLPDSTVMEEIVMRPLEGDIT